MLLKKLKHKLIVKNTLTLILGVGISQIIAILFQLITRRLYSPEVFGAYAVYFSIVSIMVSIVPLQYSRAIILPAEKKQSTNLLFGTLGIITIFSVLILISILLFPAFWINIVDFPVNYFKWLYFLPLTVMMLASYEAINYWLIRNKAFKASAINKIIRRISEGATQTGVGFTGKAFGILLGDLVGNFFNLMSGIFQSFKNGLNYRKINFTDIKIVLKRYNEFPKFYAIPNLLNTISLFLPVLIVNKFYSESIVGYFDLSRMVLAVPLALITTSLSQVLLQNFSEKRNQQKPIKKDILKIAGSLLIMVFAGVIILEFFAEYIFAIFGKQYTISGVYTKILVFSYGIKFIVSPLASVFPALERVKIGALWQVLYFCSLFLLFLFDDLSIISFLKILVGIELVSYTIYFSFIYFVAFQYDQSIKKQAG